MSHGPEMLNLEEGPPIWGMPCGDTSDPSWRLEWFSRGMLEATEGQSEAPWQHRAAPKGQMEAPIGPGRSCGSPFGDESEAEGSQQGAKMAPKWEPKVAQVKR